MASFHAEYIFEYRKKDEENAELEDELLDEYNQNPKTCCQGLRLLDKNGSNEQEGTEN